MIVTWMVLFGCSTSEEPTVKLDPVDTDDNTSTNDTAAETDTAVGEDTSIESCLVELSSVSPENGTPDFFYRDDLVVELTDFDATALIILNGPEGSHPGVLTFDPELPILNFTPSEPLLALSTYQISIETCGGTFESEFSTSELGSPLQVDVTGSSYIFDLREGLYVEPPAIGPMLNSIIEFNIMIGVTSVSESEMTARGGITLEDGETQNVCNRTVEDFPIVDYDEAATFFLQNGTFKFYIVGDPLTIHNFSMESTFLADGSGMVHTELRGLLDMRQMDGMLTPTLGELCNLLALAGSECGTCPDGQPYCFDIEITDMTGVLAVEEMECVLLDKCHPKCSRTECADPSLGECE